MTNYLFGYRVEVVLYDGGGNRLHIENAITMGAHSTVKLDIDRVLDGIREAQAQGRFDSRGAITAPPTKVKWRVET